MKILPIMSKGVVVAREDGTIEMAPLHVFRAHNGNTVIRIGRTTLWFTEDGTFDGEEVHVAAEDTPEAHAEFAALLDLSRENQGQPPEDFYFNEDDHRRVAEARSVAALMPRAKPIIGQRTPLQVYRHEGDTSGKAKN